MDAGPPVGRLTARRDYLAANAGLRVPMPAFILLVRPRGVQSIAPPDAARVGFTVSKRLGNAVARNRVRRRLREAARLTVPHAGVPGADHVFIGRPQPAEQPFAELVADARRALERARRRLGPPA